MSLSVKNSFVRTEAFAYKIDGKLTNVLWSEYSDYLMLIISQLGTTGTVVCARKEKNIDGDDNYNLSTLMGKRDEPGIHYICKQISEMASSYNYERPILFSIALENHLPSTMKQVLSAIAQDNIWLMAIAAAKAARQRLNRPIGELLEDNDVW